MISTTQRVISILTKRSVYRQRDCQVKLLFSSGSHKKCNVFGHIQWYLRVPTGDQPPQYNKKQTKEKQHVCDSFLLKPINIV